MQTNEILETIKMIDEEYLDIVPLVSKQKRTVLKSDLSLNLHIKPYKTDFVKCFSTFLIIGNKKIQ